MALSPTVSLSANNPYSSSYDPASPDAKHLTARLECLGVLVQLHPDAILANQAQADAVLLGGALAAADDEADLTHYMEQVARWSVAKVTLNFYNLNVSEQVLLVYGLKCWSHPVKAQFFVGSQFIRAEDITEDAETTAVLLDIPPEMDHLQVFMRIAAPGSNPSAWFGGAVLRGVEGFLL